MTIAHDFIRHFRKILPAKDSESPTAWLTRAYVLALLAIAGLTMLSHNIMSLLTERQIEGREISYRLGQEVALIREAGHYASSFFHENADFDMHYFKMRIEKIKEQDAIIQGYIYNNGAFDDARAKLYSMMGPDTPEVQSGLAKFIKTSERYMIYPANSEIAERKELYESIKSMSEGALPKMIETALSEYQAVQIAEMERFASIERYAAFGIILVILFEALFIFRPLTKRLEEYHKTIMRQAIEDSLTGLLNRRGFSAAFNTYKKLAMRNKQNYVVVTFDLDKFKSVNDTYGHDVGDQVLLHFSKLLKKAFRASDIISRFGGEEFVLIITNSSAKSAYTLLENFREQVATTACPYAGEKGSGEINYTTSVGYCPCSGTGDEDIELSLKKADEYLYAAKTGGRNKIVGPTIVDKQATA